MDISLKWLNKFVDIDGITPEELAKAVTSIGIEVEGIRRLASGSDLTIGYVHGCKDHPDSDHLHVCDVEIALGVRSQIVCGAPNVAAGQKVIVAKPGCVLPGGIIKSSVIRGEESNGMICSLNELGVDNKFLSDEQKSGIEVLPADAKIGEDPLAYLGLDDIVLELGLTPNRADCLAVSSFAYEVAAVFNKSVKIPEIIGQKELASEIEVEIATDKCTYFSAKLIKNVTTKESPLWMKSILTAQGIKSINNIVDIGNFVMLETGQPIHMYDYDKLVEKKFVIKTGFEQTVTMLDEKEYEVVSTDVVVSVDGKVSCLAGVFGANDCKIDENTKNIVVEAATFDGVALRNTAKRLNLLTDASQRYIKNAINTGATEYVQARCADLLVELADAKEVYETVVASTISQEEKIVDLSVSHVNRLLGTDIGLEEVKDVFNRLEMSYKVDGEIVSVVVPSRRNDISIEADLIEEVARIYGYDNLPTTLPKMSMTTGRLSTMQTRKRMIQNMLTNKGLSETRTYTLVGPSIIDDFNVYHKNDAVALMSPLSEERSLVRKSIVPSLLQTISYNQNRNINDIALYEISNTYSNEVEKALLAIAVSGKMDYNLWQKSSKKADYYLVKGYVEDVLTQLGIDETRYTLRAVEKDHKYMHPGRSAYVCMGKDIVGIVGQIHPLMAKKYDVAETYIAELDLEYLVNLKTKKMKYITLPTQLGVTRDIAIVVDKDVAAYDLVRNIKRTGKALVKGVDVFDVYEGEHVESGKKSIAFTISLQDDSKTLTDNELNEVTQAIIASLQKDYRAILRG